MVSPIAREIDRIRPATRPLMAAGMTTRTTVVTFLAPSP